MNKRLFPSLLLAAVSGLIFMTSASAQTLQVIIYGTPRSSGMGGSIYEVEQRSGQLNTNGQFTLASTVNQLVSDNELSWLAQVASKYLTPSPLSSADSAYFTVTGEYPHTTAGYTIHWYSVVPGGSGSGGSGGSSGLNNLNGTPGVIFKDGGKVVILVQKFSGKRLTDATIQRAIRLINRTLQNIRREVRSPSTDLVLPASLLKNAKKAKKLAKQAHNSNDAETRDHLWNGAGKEVEKILKKLERLAGS